jgi:Leucine-rich repeat (LRR) protein
MSSLDFPMVILRLNDLRTLAITSARMDSVPAELGSALRSLRSLDLSHNCLESIPEGVWSLPALTRLVLAHNELQPSGAVKALAPLEELDVSHNEALTALPIDDIPDSLVSLDISHTRITKLPDRGVPRLRMLRATNSALATIGGTLARDSPALATLELVGSPAETSFNHRSPGHDEFTARRIAVANRSIHGGLHT